MTSETAKLPWAIAAPFLIAGPVAYGILAAVLDMDASWDLRNYHYYNPYAFLTGRRGFDVLVADLPGFYNPILDVPFFLAAEALPARLVGFLLGVVQGLNVVALFWIAWSVIAIADLRLRVAAAAALSALGVLGGGALSELGTTFNDSVVTLGPLAALAIVLGRWSRLGFGRAALAGFVAGLAVGLKLTVGPLAAAVGLAFLVSADTWGRRFGLTAAFGLAAAAGTLASGGFWHLILWKEYASPLFPYFNTVFKSPWALVQGYRHDFEIPEGFVATALFPFRIVAEPYVTGEIQFVDFRIPVAYLLVPVGIVALLSRSGRPESSLPVAAGPALHLLAAAAIAYGLWIQLFARYRYAIGIEMLAPLAIAAAIGVLPLSRRRRVVAAAAVLAIVAVTTRTGDWGRVPWADKWVSAEVPALAEPARTLVLMAGFEPLSFLVPSFPPAVRFLRIYGYFTGPQEPDNRFNPHMRAIVDAHSGPLFALFIPNDSETARRNLGAYGLAIDVATCRSIPSSIGKMPYGFCALRRT